MDHFAFIEPNRDLSNALAGNYDPGLVFLSVIVAVAACYTGFLLSERVRASDSLSQRIYWGIAGALALGGGIWAMHFIGMLAYELPIPNEYDPWLTALSIIPVALASLIVLHTGDSSAGKSVALPVRAILMGMGIGAMHYSGMMAMHLDAEMLYDPWLFSLSIVVAVGLSYLALFIKQLADSGSPGIGSRRNSLTLASLIMGSAITGMHYSAMLATYFLPGEVAIHQYPALERSTMVMVVPLVVSGVLLLSVIAVSVSRRLAMVEEIREREARLKAIFDTVTDGIIVIDGTGIIESANPVAQNIFGYRAEELIGHNVSMLMDEPHASQHDDYLRRYQETGVARIIGIGRTVGGRRKDGTIFPLDLSISVTHTPTKSALYTGIVRDITERVRVENELQMQRDQLRHAAAEERIVSELLRAAVRSSEMAEFLEQVLDILFGSVPWLKIQPKGAIFLVDDEGRGHNLRLVASRDLATQLHTLCAEVPFGQCLCGRAAAERKIQFTACVDEHHETRFDGMLPHGHYNVPVLQGDAILGVMVFFLSHGHRQAESELALLTQVADVVAIGIGRRYAKAALIEAKEQAETAAKAKSQFLAAMSHEIRTPMNGVVGVVEVLSHTSLDDNQRDLLNIMRESAFSLLGIIDDILDFSKIEAGRLDLEQVPLSLTSLIESVGEALLPLANRKGVELLLFCDPHLPEIQADPVRLRQVLFNLAGNAVKFTGGNPVRRGRVVIRAELEALSAQRAQLLLRVEDNGIGISPEVQTQLFQPFVQAESSTTRRFGGTGLGLTISRRLVELMGGHISLESQTGKGSIFSVYLDLPVASDNIESPDFELTGIKVLVLSQDEVVRSLIERYLSYAGATVTAVSNDQGLAQQARAAAGSELVVVMDGDGTQDAGAARDHMRQELGDLRLRFVVISRGQRRRARLVGDDGVAVDLDAMRRKTFLHAVAVAAGRASLEKIPPVADALPGPIPLTLAVAEAAGMLILVAEDNEINRKVLSHQLGMLGYPAELAADGREALERWREGRFGLVLTDCHMPEMDGYDLARAIRREEDGKQHIPIIAITADALKGTDQSCLAAGMDDYLSKPVQLYVLQEKLKKWLPVESLAAGDEIPAATDRVADASAVDPSALAEVLGVDDKTMLANFYHDFANNCAETVAAMESACIARQHGEIGTLAHRLKSSARSVGANALADCCLVLEQSGKAGDWVGIDRQMAELPGLFASVKACIQDYVSQAGA